MKEIRQFTIAELQYRLGDKATSHHDELLVSDSRDVLKVFSVPVNLSVYAFIFCTDGTLDCTINVKSYRVEPNSVVVVQPGDILHVSSEENAQVSSLFVSPIYMRELQLHFAHLMLDSLGLRQCPVVHIPDEVTPRLDGSLGMPATLRREVFVFNELIRHYMTDGSDAADEILRALTGVVVCSTITMFHRQDATSTVARTDAKLGRNAHASLLLERFLSILAAHQHVERTVRFYAKQMGLTPNYLSGAIKAYSGRTALEWINDYVTLEAKRRLKYSDESIHEIARALNFPSQSAFGKYFKLQTGMSPLAYRMS